MFTSFPAGTTVKALLEHDNQKRGTLCVQDKSLPVERPTNKYYPPPPRIAARGVPLVCVRTTTYDTRHAAGILLWHDFAAHLIFTAKQTWTMRTSIVQNVRVQQASERPRHAAH